MAGGMVFDNKGQRQTSGWTLFPMTGNDTSGCGIVKKYDFRFMADEGIASIMQFLLDRGIYTDTVASAIDWLPIHLTVFLPTSVLQHISKELQST